MQEFTDEFIGKSGIYKIENIEDGQAYIGQSKNICKRWAEHRSALRHDHHPNKHLQNAWNKYGEGSFIFCVLELCPQDVIDEKEKYWIAQYSSNERGKGYNFSIGGEGTAEGYTFSNEQKEKMSKQRNAPRVVQVSCDGNIIKVWRSASHAERSGVGTASAILKCCRHDGIVTSDGYIWIFEKELIDKEFDINKYKKELKVNPISKIYQYDLYGTVLHIWENIAEIRQHFGDKIAGGVCTCCKHKGKYKQYNDSIWRYDYESDQPFSDDFLFRCRLNSGTYKVEQYSLDGIFLKLWTVNEIIEMYGNTATIRGNCIGKSHSAYGYIWRYEGDTSKIIDDEALFKARSKGYKKRVLQFDPNGNFIKKYDSTYEAARGEFARDGIITCCQGYRENYGGYIWRYETLQDFICERRGLTPSLLF